MEENRRTIVIDPKEMQDLSTLFGLLCRVVEDDDIHSDFPHDERTIPLFVGSFLLKGELSPTMQEAAQIAMMDALLFRKDMPATPREIVYPDWDPEGPGDRKTRLLADAFFAFYSYHLYASKKIEIPDQSLGAIFSLAGYALFGVEQGYDQKTENLQSLYPSYQAYLEKSFAQEGGFASLLSKMLNALEQGIKERKEKIAQSANS